MLSEHKKFKNLLKIQERIEDLISKKEFEGIDLFLEGFDITEDTDILLSVLVSTRCVSSNLRKREEFYNKVYPILKNVIQDNYYLDGLKGD